VVAHFGDHAEDCFAPTRRQTWVVSGNGARSNAGAVAIVENSILGGWKRIYFPFNAFGSRPLDTGRSDARRGGAAASALIDAPYVRGGGGLIIPRWFSRLREGKEFRTPKRRGSLLRSGLCETVRRRSLHQQRLLLLGFHLLAPIRWPGLQTENLAVSQ